MCITQWNWRDEFPTQGYSPAVSRPTSVMRDATSTENGTAALPLDVREEQANISTHERERNNGAMKEILGTAVALAVMAMFASPAQAAINITQATIQNGQVFIAGDQAQRRADISWEDGALGIKSTAGGAFQFNTTNLPVDCVGRLKIGTDERDVVINNCRSAG